MSPMNNRRMTPTQEPGILDFAPGAAAAYSLRNLSLSYTGPVVTVRRSTDNAEADFTASEVSDGTLAGWAGADGFVKQWWDQSGNARHATASGTAQPQIVDSGVLVTEGGKAAVQFDGSDDRLTASLPAGNVTGQLILVVAAWTPTGTTTATIQALIDNNHAASGGFVIQDRPDKTGKPVSYTPDAGVLPFTLNTDTGGGSLVILSCQADGSLANIWTNGATSEPSSVAVQPYLVKSTLSIGAWDNNGSPARYLTGKISEAIIYLSDQTALRTRIEGNLAWTYNA